MSSYSPIDTDPGAPDDLDSSAVGFYVLCPTDYPTKDEGANADLSSCLKTWQDHCIEYPTLNTSERDAQDFISSHGGFLDVFRSVIRAHTAEEADAILRFPAKMTWTLIRRNKAIRNEYCETHAQQSSERNFVMALKLLTRIEDLLEHLAPDSTDPLTEQKVYDSLAKAVRGTSEEKARKYFGAAICSQLDPRYRVLLRSHPTFLSKADSQDAEARAMWSLADDLSRHDDMAGSIWAYDSDNRPLQPPIFQTKYRFSPKDYSCPLDPSSAQASELTQRMKDLRDCGGYPNYANRNRESYIQNFLSTNEEYRDIFRCVIRSSHPGPKTDRDLGLGQGMTSRMLKRNHAFRTEYTARHTSMACGPEIALTLRLLSVAEEIITRGMRQGGLTGQDIIDKRKADAESPCTDYTARTFLSDAVSVLDPRYRATLKADPRFFRGAKGAAILPKSWEMDTAVPRDQDTAGSIYSYDPAINSQCDRIFPVKATAAVSQPPNQGSSANPFVLD